LEILQDLHLIQYEDEVGADVVGVLIGRLTMKPRYDFLSREESEWVERCQAMAIVLFVVVVGVFTATGFGG
jgi:hypothetical protein